MNAAPNSPSSSNPAADTARYGEFLTLFARDRDRLYSYIYSMLPHAADAEDVFQRASILLWSKFDQFERERSFLAWARGVAFYEVRNFLRTSSRDRLQFTEELVAQIAQRTVETAPHQEDRLTALRGCLERLPEGPRKLVSHVYSKGGTIQELAEASGRAVQTLYNQLSQTRRKLLECVEQKLAEGAAT
jgi:RNA polymerase sigma-70 factor (ECF subfamily)